jgi:O-methyltransferase involved in polyketide biosynthesis
VGDAEVGGTELEAVQRTLLTPLRARARDASRRRPLLADRRASELVAALGLTAGGSLVSVLRAAVIDQWVGDFLAAHRGGTVIELGCGLGTRSERLGGSAAGERAHWLDIDLPEVAGLRRDLLPDAGSRTTFAGSVLDEDWLDVARRHPGPYLLVSESVLVHLPEQGVQRLVDMIGRVLPGAMLVTDTVGRAAAERLESSAPLGPLGLTFDWTCEDPVELEPWGLRLQESRRTGELPPATARRAGFGHRAGALSARLTRAERAHRLARYEVLAR